MILDLLQELDAVGAGHADVREDQVEADVVELAHGIVGVAGRGARIARADEPFGKDLANGVLVINNQDVGAALAVERVAGVACRSQW